MRSDLDLSPYRRSTVGFDRLFDLLENGPRGDDGYPPFDLVRVSDDTFRIDLAMPGYAPEEVEIIAHQNQVSVSGKRAERDAEANYIHRGIGIRPFEKRFALADFIQVESASFRNGLLSIGLRRVVPEAMKPRKIDIGMGEPAGAVASSAEQSEPA